MDDTTTHTVELSSGRESSYDDAFFGHPFTPDRSGGCVWEGGPIGMKCGAGRDHEWHLMFGRTPDEHTASGRLPTGDADG